jgi:hypothetical protein
MEKRQGRQVSKVSVSTVERRAMRQMTKRNLPTRFCCDAQSLLSLFYNNIQQPTLCLQVCLWFARRGLLHSLPKVAVSQLSFTFGNL